MTKPTTVYIDAKLLEAVKLKAVHGHTSVSRLVNDALKYTLKEDAIDLKAAHARRNEPRRSFEDVLKDLKRDGKL